MAITLQQSVQSPHRRSPDEAIRAFLVRVIAPNLGEMAAKIRRSAAKAPQNGRPSIPGLFTLSPMPCIKGMVISPLLA
ncbi:MULTISPECIES: hypothetical protein [unclassified Bradyrhizobium]